MEEPIKILLADDQPMFLEGLQLLLEQETKVKIVGMALNGVQLLYLAKELEPDVIITDIEMPEMDGVEATKRLRESDPCLGIISLTVFGEDWRIVDMLKAGARGYLLKNSKKEELLTAIEVVKAGGRFYCSRITERLHKMLSGSLEAMKEPDENLLNSKEKQIVRLICQEYSSKEIGTIMNLSLKTIENYRNRIIEKIKATNMAGIVVYGMLYGYYKKREDSKN